MKFLISLVLFLHISSALIAQTNVSILKADELIGRNTPSGQVRVLRGNVKLKIDKNELKSDSALHFLDRNEIRAYGNVFIQNDEDKIWADSALYNSDSDLSYFYGNLLIERDSSKLFSTRASYSFPQKTSYFTAPFQLEDSQGILKADRGIYFHENDSASFRGNVQVVDSTLFVEADSLLGNRKAKLYELFNNVYAFDRKNNSYVTAEYVYIDSSGQRLMRENALLIKVDSAKADTISIRGEKIFYQENKDSTFSFEAFETVQIFSKDFSSYSDSAEYDSKTERFELESNAYSWNKKLQLSAPNIIIQAEDDTIRTIHAFPKPFAVQVDSISSRFQQMRGDSLWSDFEKGSLKQVRFTPNAAVAFFTNNDKDEPDGLMVVHSSQVIMSFTDGDLTDMNAEEDVKATYSEEKVGVELYQLNGFTWKPELRPEKPIFPVSQKMKPEITPFSKYPKHHPEYKKPIKK